MRQIDRIVRGGDYETKMDLVIGVAKDPRTSCLFAINYNDSWKRHFISPDGDVIEILAVFLGKGSSLEAVRRAMSIKSTAVVWFQASPGQVTDEVHSIINPTSIANTHLRSMDVNLRLTEVQSHDSEREAKKPGDGDSDGPATAKSRRIKPLHCP